MQNLLNKVYNIIPSHYFGLIGIMAGGLGFGLAVLFYSIADPNYFFLANFISELSVGPNNADILFFITLIIMGILFIPYFLSYSWFLKDFETNKTSSSIGLLFLVIYAISSILLAFFPMNRNNSTSYDLHIFFASILFGSLCIGFFSFGLAEISIKKINIYLKTLTILLAIFSGLFTILLILGHFTDLYSYDIIIYLIEWTVFGLFTTWVLSRIFLSVKLK